MPRPISWQRRLNKMHQLVKDSPQTPYTKVDVAKLFQIGTEAAKKLVAIMPRTHQANALVVEREDLLQFLGHAVDAEDLRAYLDTLKRDPPKPRRRKVRLFVPGNFQPGVLQSGVLRQHGMWLDRGKLEMHWSTLDDFLSKMKMLIETIEDPSFERRFCELAPHEDPRTRMESREADYIRAENRLFDQLAAARKACLEHDAERALKLIETVRATRIEVAAIAHEVGIEAMAENDDYIAKAVELLQTSSPASTLESSAAYPPPPEREDSAA